MTPSTFGVLLNMVTLAFDLAGARWSNDLGGMLSRSCMYGFGITSIRSQHVESNVDRLWEIGCSRVGLPRGDDVCVWTCEYNLP